MSRLFSPPSSAAVVLDSITPISILIADDSEPWRNQVRYLLENRPGWYIVAEARDGLEAVQKAEELKPDVVILDVAMPNLNGIAAAIKIRNHSAKPRIILLSTFKDEQIREAAFLAGAEAYITKANAGNELVKVISSALISAQ